MTVIRGIRIFKVILTGQLFVFIYFNNKQHVNLQIA